MRRATFDEFSLCGTDEGSDDVPRQRSGVDAVKHERSDHGIRPGRDETLSIE